MTTIDIVLYEGVDDLDVVGPLEVLRGAAKSGADLTVRLVVRTEPLEVVSAHGLMLRADAVYEPGADILVVPGGSWRSRAAVGAWGEAERGDWLPLIREAAGSGTVMAGVCTGGMLLARAGVVRDRPATTHHGAHDDLAATGATVLDQRVVDDGDLITSGGVTSGIDLALRLVERLAGPEAAEREATRIEYPWTRAEDQARPAHPAPTGHKITTEKIDGVVSARWAGEVIAESGDALLLREAGLARPSSTSPWKTSGWTSSARPSSTPSARSRARPPTGASRSATAAPTTSPGPTATRSRAAPTSPAASPSTPTASSPWTCPPRVRPAAMLALTGPRSRRPSGLSRPGGGPRG